MNFGIIGAGGWGTAIADVLSQNNHKIILWSYEKETAQEITTEHTNKIYLPQAQLSQNVTGTNAIEDLAGCDYYIIATPTQFIRSVIEMHRNQFEGQKFINLAKGIEKNSLFRVSQILYEAAGVEPDNYAILTGPSHAEEVIKRMPTTVVAASENHIFAGEVQKLFNTSYFRVYESPDVIGCELGGALKNVIALAAGVVDGLGLGDNTKAALITRGLAEMTRLGVTIGSQQMTFFGLSGLGDLFVTCSSKLSRNRFVGEQIGKGRKLSEIISEMKMVAEGVQTCSSAYSLIQKHNVEMPIIEQMYAVLFEDMTPIEGMQNLMNRKSKKEWWG